MASVLDAIALDGLVVLAVGLSLLGIQLTDHGQVLNDAVRRVLDALPEPLRVHERFTAPHWQMVSNLWKYALVLAVAVVLTGVDLAWLNLTSIDPTRTVAGGLALALVVYPVGELTALAADALGYEYSTEMRSAVTPAGARGWFGFVGVALLLVSAWEELLFRGVLVGVAAATFGISPWITGALAVLVFGAIHQYAPGNVIVAGMMGAVLTIAFVLGANLLLLVVAHTAANTIEFALYESPVADSLPTDRLGFAS